jgi:hypothetical protein
MQRRRDMGDLGALQAEFLGFVKQLWAYFSLLKVAQKNSIRPSEPSQMANCFCRFFSAASKVRSVTPCAFDVLAIDGDDLRNLPLSIRKANLA